jgi:hypothetical protein
VKFYVSYRPDDAGEIAQHLRKELCAEHVDSVPPGQDFRQVIHTAVEGRAAVLVVIGERWLTPSQPTMRRHLDDPDDFVRLEIEAAFELRVSVIAVLIGSATMPLPGELPPSLEPLSSCLVVPVRPGAQLELDIRLLSRVLHKYHPYQYLEPAASLQRYFCYASRPRLERLDEQLKTSRASAAPEPGSAPLPMRFGSQQGIKELGNPERISETLSTVLARIRGHERVFDLKKLCEEKQGIHLDALCYTYRGWFQCLGLLDRQASSGLYAGREEEEYSVERSSEGPWQSPESKISLSEEFLRAPARRENAYHEVGPNQSSIVSPIAVLRSRISPLALIVACPLKFFSEMAGNWQEAEQEWQVTPGRGNRHFFRGLVHVWFESVLFVHGMTGGTIWGSPLCLITRSDPALIL